MGLVDGRLARLYGTVREGTALPIVVLTNVPVDAQVLQQASAAGASSASRISDRAYKASATESGARSVAALPSTAAVYYDEPVSPVVGR